MLTTPLDGYVGERPPSSTDGDATPVQEPDGVAPEDAPTTTPDASVDAPAQSRYASEVLNDAPVLYFRFGEPSSATQFRDEVTGLLIDVPTVGVLPGVPGALASESNTAISFDGAGGVPLPKGQEFLQKAAFSVEIWVNQAADVPSFAFILDHESFTSGRRGWSIWGGDQFGFELRTAAVNSSAQSPATKGVWRHFVATMDGTAQRLFIDGVLTSTNVEAVTMTEAIGIPYMLGHQNCSPCTMTEFHGALDELAIYSKALSQARINAHFTAGK